MSLFFISSWSQLIPYLNHLGEEYFELVDEFMAAIKLRWPRALIQHEDFQVKLILITFSRVILFLNELIF